MKAKNLHKHLVDPREQLAILEDSSLSMVGNSHFFPCRRAFVFCPAIITDEWPIFVLALNRNTKNLIKCGVLRLYRAS